MAIDRQRYDAILKEITASELQALACFSSSGVLLLTGYWPVMGSSVAFFTREGEVGGIVPEDELELAKATSNVKFVSYKPATLDRLAEPAVALGQAIRDHCEQFHLVAGPIGTELEDGAQAAAYQSGNHFRTSVVPLLHRAHPDIQVVSADAMLSRLKSVKTSVELELLRRACQLAETGFDEARRAIVPGRRENEVAADVGAAFARVANNGFERGDGYFFCMSGPNSFKAAGAYARTRTRTLQEGDLVMIHANTVGDGYWTDITRTYVVGHPTDMQQRMRNAIDDARQAALESICPGVCASAVDLAARNVLAKHGFGDTFKHGAGHGVGFAAADANALPRIHPQSPDKLETRMTFNIEPAIYIDGIGGMRHCDVVACTDAEAQVLTDFQ
jgi:Xaa-Pro aminopeptidase